MDGQTGRHAEGGLARLEYGSQGLPPTCIIDGFFDKLLLVLTTKH